MQILCKNNNAVYVGIYYVTILDVTAYNRKNPHSRKKIKVRVGT